LVFWYGIRNKWFTSRVNRATIALQASYALPLGAGGVVEVLNGSAGKLFMSTVIGPEALAFYVIGTFAKQIVNLFRGAIADTIFPEIVELKHAVPKDALPLWQRATLWYCILIFPIAIVVSYYADAVVTILFTREYSAAVPVFAIFSLAMILDCFDVHMPLRVQNANRYFLVGSIIALLVNLILLYPMYVIFGLIGPAVAFVLSRLILTIFLGHWTLRIYKVSLRDLVRWAEIAKVFAAALICSPILVFGRLWIDDLFVRSVLAGGAYLVAYLAVIRWWRVWDALILLRVFIRPR
jgi:O-antigen/teichoic acid export membrane protein